MTYRDKFRKGFLWRVWRAGITPLSKVCHPERSEGSASCCGLQIPRSARDDNSFWDNSLRQLCRFLSLEVRVPRIVLFTLIVIATASWAADPQAIDQHPAETPSQFGAIVPYLGLPIERIELPGIAPEESAVLVAATPLKIGASLTRENLHDAMQALYATGRFSDIQAEADRTGTGVRLRFQTVANYFVGILTIEGVSTNPSANQLVSATRFQLGELYTKEKLDRALDGIQRILVENGLNQAKVTSSEQRNEQQHQINLTFHVTAGARALVGEISLEGDAGYSVEEIKDIAKLHPGNPVISNRISRALQRIRSRYQKQDRLLAQVSISNRTYHADRNTIDYVLKVDRGPAVEISADGFKLSQRTLKKLVPIYEEGAVDDDLLNEGRRSIQNHLQTLGYFEAGRQHKPREFASRRKSEGCIYDQARGPS